VWHDRRVRAVRLHELGGRLQVDEIDEPVPADGEVLVDLAFASVNPLDVWITRGGVGAAASNLPWIPGTEATGRIGERAVLVRGAGLGVLRPGLSRERAAVPADAVIDVPAGIDLAAAAALPVAGITAWQAVHAKAHVQADDRVLVLGASGGVGSLAVQLAKETGATVWGQTGREAKAAGIEASGADRAVVASASGLAAAVGELEPTVVLDALGGDFTDAAVEAIAVGGRLVVYGTSSDEVVTLNLRRLYRKGATLLGYSGLVETAAQQRAVLVELFARLADGRLHVPIADVLPLAQAAAAHERIVEQRVEGKLVLDCGA
jgi:NADPH2:quinone reductase